MRSELPYNVINYLKLPQILNHTFFKTSVSILMYHGIIRTKLPVEDWCFISETTFREQLTYIRNHFRLTSLSDAVDLLQTGSVREPTAVITFDDGFTGTYDCAFPLLKTTCSPATIFLSTKLVDTDDTIWFCRLNQALTATAEPELVWRGTTFRIDGLRQKAAVSRLLQETLKSLPRDQLKAEVHEITELLELQDERIGKTSPFRILSSGQISDMQGSGLIGFGAHTHSHSILSRLSAEEQEEEIVLSKLEVERLTKRPCRFFSYPNGRRQDYGNTAIRLLKSAGFDAALTTIPGPVDKNSPLMELSRYDVGGNMELASFRSTVHHFGWTGKKLLTGSVQ